MPKPIPRGRPRNFDKQVVLQVIMKTFQTNGFSATSLDDLSAATGLTRPSLYAAFGNKTEMYLQALEEFARQMVEAMMPPLENEDRLEMALKGFYDGALTMYFGTRKQSLGCLVFTTAIADVTAHTNIKKAVAGFVAGLDDAVTRCILAHAPDLSRRKARSYAQLASGLLMNIATRARAGAPREELEPMASASAKLIAQSVIR